MANRLKIRRIGDELQAVRTADGCRLTAFDAERDDARQWIERGARRIATHCARCPARFAIDLWPTIGPLTFGDETRAPIR